MGPSEGERLDALRRRVYAPGATEEDIEAYRIAAAHDEAPPEQPVAEVVVPPPSRRRSPLVGIVAGAVALLVAVSVVALIQLRPLAPEPSRSPTPSATQARIPTTAADRAAFVRALDSGQAPGLADYVSRHPGSPPPALRPTGRAASHEYSGQATQTITLDPPTAADRGGRVTVIVLLDGDGSFSWQAERVDQADDRSGPVVPVASHAGSARAGEPVTATVSYTGKAPTRLAVFVAESVRWAVVVTFTD